MHNLLNMELNFLKLFPNTPEAKVIRYQLAKVSTSTGANYEESQAGSSKADFANKIRISLREMRESNYWLRITAKCFNFEKKGNDKLLYLVSESMELKKILASILNKVS